MSFPERQEISSHIQETTVEARADIESQGGASMGFERDGHVHLGGDLPKCSRATFR